MWSPTLVAPESIKLALTEGHPTVSSPDRKLAGSIRTALGTVDPELTKGISAVRTVPVNDMAIAARSVGYKGAAPVFVRAGDQILVDAAKFGALDPRMRTRLVREAIAQHQWATNRSLRSGFGKLYKADSSLRRLGTNSRAAFCRAFSRLNGGLSREIGFARYYGGVDRWMRSALGKASLSEPQRAFYQLMKTGRGLGAEIRTAGRTAIGRYEQTLNGITKRIGLPGVPAAKLVDPAKLEKMNALVKANRTSMVRTYNNRLARHVSEVSEQLRARGVAVTQKSIAKVAKSYADSEFARQQLIAQRYEDAWAQSAATQDFMEENGVTEGYIQVMPDWTAICLNCSRLISDSPYRLPSRPSEMPPLHKNCIHGIEYHASPGTISPEAWRGEDGSRVFRMEETDWIKDNNIEVKENPFDAKSTMYRTPDGMRDIKIRKQGDEFMTEAYVRDAKGRIADKSVVWASSEDEALGIARAHLTGAPMPSNVTVVPKVVPTPAPSVTPGVIRVPSPAGDFTLVGGTEAEHAKVIEAYAKLPEKAKACVKEVNFVEKRTLNRWAGLPEEGKESACGMYSAETPGRVYIRHQTDQVWLDWNLEHTFVHEVGHSVEHNILLGGSPTADIGSAWKPMFQEMQRQKWTNVNMTQYGMRNPAEMLAESFAKYTLKPEMTARWWRPQHEALAAIFE
ncbi:hypothetical protein ACFLXE_00340 [Chloroflexota bacterium]